MKKTTVLTTVLLAALISFGVAQPSYANLTAMGPIDPADGFPAYYTDTNGLSLAKCNVENLYSPNVLPRVPPSNNPGAAPTWMCVLGSTAGSPTCPPVGVDAIVAGCYNDKQPIVPVGFTNFPFETFYFNANIVDQLCPTCAPRSLKYLAAVEATFLTPTGAPPINQFGTAASVFQRIRIILDIPVGGGGTYVVTHPYPVVPGTTGETFINVPVGNEAVKFVANFPAAGIPFSSVTTGPIGPFLRTAATEGGTPIAFFGAVDLLGAPIPGRQFIGDPNLKPGVLGQPPMTVTGSPVGQNFVSVVGPLVNYRQNQFTLMGMVAPNRGTKLVDFDGDGKTDIAIYRAINGGWYIIPSATPGTPIGVGWGGLAGDVSVPGDYDGDGKADVATYRGANGGWYIIPSSGIPTGTPPPYGVGWGGDASDIPVPGDYDGDGKTDIAIYRGSNGGWYIIPSATPGTPIGVGWGGTLGDIPVPGDYDGDGKTDIAIYRGSNGGWYIIPSGGGAPYGVVWWSGTIGDIPVPGDYDGDGKTDLAFITAPPFNWRIMPSSTNIPYAMQWGNTAAGDKPVPGDYNGDGKTDIAIYRPSTGAWYVIPSGGLAPYGVGWGGDASDKPVTPPPIRP